MANNALKSLGHLKDAQSHHASLFKPKTDRFEKGKEAATQRRWCQRTEKLAATMSLLHSC